MSGGAVKWRSMKQWTALQRGFQRSMIYTILCLGLFVIVGRALLDIAGQTSKQAVIMSYDTTTVNGLEQSHENRVMEAVLNHARVALMQRVCGQPAEDGYAHVNASCLEQSPTNRWFQMFEAAGGKRADLVSHIEMRADYDGLAVAWGINNKKESVEECAEACRTHQPNPEGSGPFDHLPCNVFVWCGDQHCFEPDAHHHTLHDCWLKFSEAPAYPEVNMRGTFPKDYALRHPNAPKEVQWASGALLPPGTTLTNGTWSLRWSW